MPAPPYRRVKIMGERNSGTNFVQALVALNFAVDLLPNAMPYTAREEALIGRIPLTRCVTDALFHRGTDRSHDQGFHRHGGWKHACLTPRHFQDLERAGETLFLCVLRHPAPWLLSMFRAPFAIFNHETRAASVDAFLDTPWVTRARDEIPAMVLENPALLWVHKVTSYLDWAEAMPNVRILRHEDLLRDHASALSALARVLPAKVETWQVPRDNARQSFPRDPATERDFQHLRDALPEDPFRLLPDQTATRLRAVVGADLLARAGYAGDTG